MDAYGPARECSAGRGCRGRERNPRALADQPILPGQIERVAECGHRAADARHGEHHQPGDLLIEGENPREDRPRSSSEPNFSCLSDLLKNIFKIVNYVRF